MLAGRQSWNTGVSHGRRRRTWNVFSTGSVRASGAALRRRPAWLGRGRSGAILATADGGRTWQCQQAGGARVALLGLFADPEDVPLELVVRLAGDEGYRIAMETIGRRDIETASRDEEPDADRLHEAVVLANGFAADAAWQFPLRKTGLRFETWQITDTWDRIYDGRGLETLRATWFAAFGLGVPRRSSRALPTRRPTTRWIG